MKPKVKFRAPCSTCGRYKTYRLIQDTGETIYYASWCMQCKAFSRVEQRYLIPVA
jgi:hypothetical protein